MSGSSSPSGGPSDWIRVAGARQNNLRNVDLRLPRHAITVVTGLSGSGKSSLAMDTLYAEAQRRYLEGVAPHARRFLDRLPRPDVDRIDGLSPALCLEQRTSVRGARSTVGTTTEIHDFLRLLLARVGRVHCLECGEEVHPCTVASTAERWGAPAGRRLTICFPRRVGTRERSRAAGELRAAGYRRLRSPEGILDLETATPPAGLWHVIQDRLRGGDGGRLLEALEAAFREGGGRAEVFAEDGAGGSYRLGRYCAACGTRSAEPHPLQFSFNSPLGACPACQGFGYVLEPDPAKVVPDPSLSLDEGALHPWAGKWRRWFLRRLERSARTRGIPRRVPWSGLAPEDREVLMHGDRTFVGVLPFLRNLERKSYKAGARFLARRYRSQRRCADCGGARLGESGRTVRLGGRSLPEWCDLPIGTLRKELGALDLEARERETAARILGEVDHRLGVLERVGVEYLTLGRLTRSLSGGEAQRIELAQAMGARLVDTLYVLDEPTIGLHPRDTGRLVAVLRDLVAGGNTVVVVEHDPEVMAAAEWMVDLGPGSGAEGGTVVYCGPGADRARGPRSATQAALGGAPLPIGPRLREPRGWIRLRRITRHNLRDLDVDLPLGTLTGVCGVSGSGKSTLVEESLIPLLDRWVAGGGERPAPGTLPGVLRLEGSLRHVTVVDQSPLTRSARSVPVSYVGAWNAVRAVFASLPEARTLGWGPGRFSFNRPGGRCESCRGEGETVIDMDFMPDVRVPCEACRGSRFVPEIENVRFRGRSIVEVLDLTVDQAVSLFHDRPGVARPLWWLQRTGLGYLQLGRPATTLSGGEAQRLKLVRELAAGRRDGLIVLDEPTVGLHQAEVARLVRLLGDLVDGGNSVIVVEHNVDVLAACDWLVELGPGGGEAGGMLVASGPPAALARTGDSPTAPYLRRRLFPEESPPVATSSPASEEG